MGYQNQGFEVIGVDIEPQPDYPFSFYQVDALEVLRDVAYLRTFTAVHASPPCQAYLKGSVNKGGHPMLTEPVRELLLKSGVPYIMENPAARPDVELCGLTFGLRVFRHRKFELGGWTCPTPHHPSHRGHRVRGWRHGVYYEGDMIAAYGKGGGKASVAEMQAGMQMPWVTTHHGLVEAIPPAYTAYLARHLAARVFYNQLTSAI